MEPIIFSENLEQNIRLMQQLFEGDNTFVLRRTKSPAGLLCAVFFFDGMVNSLAINQSVIEPLVTCSLARASASVLAQTILQINDSHVQPNAGALFASFLYGDTVIFTEGDSRPVVVNTKGFALRSSSEPENERVLSGPHEGFTECFMPNLALIRRRLSDRRLKFTFLRVGNRSHTVVCLCWLGGVCPKRLVQSLKTRIGKLDADSVLDSNYLAERIRDHRFSIFPTLGSTERPDVVAARLLEGRLAIVSDGSPVVLTAPFLFQECFQSNDDYYLPFLRSGASRLLRFFGFLVTISCPSAYVALLLWHRQMIPLRLLLSLSAAQRGVPMPVFWEILVLLVILELLREAGARTPGAMGQTMSIVGGLVLGQAAVGAHLIAAPGIIIAAIAGITGLIVPKLQTAALYLRMLLLFCGALFGLYGITLALGIALSMLCAMHSCGVPYLLNLVPRVQSEQEDTFFRAPWFFMRKDRYPLRKDRRS